MNPGKTGMNAMNLKLWFFCSAHEMRAHETIFFTVNERLLMERVFALAHETSFHKLCFFGSAQKTGANETSFW